MRPLTKPNPLPMPRMDNPKRLFVSFVIKLALNISCPYTAPRSLPRLTIFCQNHYFFCRRSAFLDDFGVGNPHFGVSRLDILALVSGRAAGGESKELDEMLLKLLQVLRRVFPGGRFGVVKQAALAHTIAVPIDTRVGNRSGQEIGDD